MHLQFSRINSLIGTAARWYMQLSRSHIRSWDDFANAFLAQYKHMVDEAPDRMTLLNIEKKATESFREYAQRWRDFASQVQPLLTERETAKIFVTPLKEYTMTRCWEMSRRILLIWWFLGSL